MLALYFIAFAIVYEILFIIILCTSKYMNTVVSHIYELFTKGDK